MVDLAKADGSTPQPRTSKGFDVQFLLLMTCVVLIAAMGIALVVRKANLPTHDEVQTTCIQSGGEVVMSEGFFGPSYGCRGTDGKIVNTDSRS